VVSLGVYYIQIETYFGAYRFVEVERLPIENGYQTLVCVIADLIDEKLIFGLVFDERVVFLVVTGQFGIELLDIHEQMFFDTMVVLIDVFHYFPCGI